MRDQVFRFGHVTLNIKPIHFLKKKNHIKKKTLEYFFILHNAITCVQIKDNNSEYSYNDTLVVVTCYSSFITATTTDHLAHT